MHPGKFRRLAIPAALAVFLLMAACGGGNGGGASNGAAQPSNEEDAALVQIVATNFRFDQPEYVIRKGEPVTFELTNNEGYHEVRIEGLNIRLKPGEPRQYVITEAGTYKVVCSIVCGAGHSSMVSRLIVEE
jgi:cytochrome c oxidase subunit 2